MVAIICSEKNGAVQRRKGARDRGNKEEFGVLEAKFLAWMKFFRGTVETLWYLYCCWLGFIRLELQHFVSASQLEIYEPSKNNGVPC